MKTLLTILLILVLVFLSLFDFTVHPAEKFEDGSGRVTITYCLPLSPCSK